MLKDIPYILQSGLPACAPGLTEANSHLRRRVSLPPMPAEIPAAAEVRPAKTPQSRKAVKPLPPMTDAVNKLIAAERTAVYHYALHITRDVNEADELTQNTLVRAMLRQETFTPGTHLRAWLKKICYHQFIESRRRKRPTVDIDDCPAARYRHEGGLSRAERNLYDYDCESIISRLPAKLAEPLLLYSQGFQYPEISDMMKLPSGTVKNRIFLARRELFKTVKRETWVKQ